MHFHQRPEADAAQPGTTTLATILGTVRPDPYEIDIALPAAAPAPARLVYFGLQGFSIALAQPLDARLPQARLLEQSGPGIHHLCFAVDDLEGTLARCRAAGVRLIDEHPRLGAEGKRIAFLHPASTAGVLVELTEY